MKTRATITLTLTLIACSLAFGGDRYTQTMKKNIEALYNAGSTEDLQQAVNTLERIGAAEKDKWEPFYYASFGYIMMANHEQEPAAKDRRLDQAQDVFNKARELAPGEPEVVALEGFIHMMRLTVDPATRGQQYSGMATQAFSKALAIDPDNPRALALLAQMQFGTARFFGNPPTEACATLNKALEKFDTFVPVNELAPTWGRPMAEGLKEGCL